jgi:hypothetical protein
MKDDYFRIRKSGIERVSMITPRKFYFGAIFRSAGECAIPYPSIERVLPGQP